MILLLLPWMRAAIPPTPPTQRRPVLVELFTSEGCSSCPPADDLLSRLEKDQSIPAARIIALEFHVDYWDYIGWRDPYSDTTFTTRQRNYAASLHLPSVYTPQMIVEGTTAFVGSSSGEAQRAILQATKGTTWAIELTLEKDVLDVRIPAAPAPASAPAEVLVALAEEGLESRVLRGENGGRTLHHAAVVRELRILGTLTGAAFHVKVPLKLKAGWNPKKMRAVVFAQERGSRKVLGAAEIHF